MWSSPAQPRPPGSQPDPGRPYSPMPRSILARAVRGRAAGASRDGALDHQPPVAAVGRPSQERTVIPCLQRACRLPLAVADLATPHLRCWPKGQVVGGRCGHDCGHCSSGPLQTIAGHARYGCLDLLSVALPVAPRGWMIVPWESPSPAPAESSKMKAALSLDGKINSSRRALRLWTPVAHRLGHHLQSIAIRLNP
jgi:hypothetical protein